VITDPIARLVHQLSRLPGIGEKTATRLAYHVLRAEPELATELAEALVVARREVRFCGRCQDLSAVDPCQRCVDPRRNPARICVVERPQDLRSVDASGAFDGHYHVLHGALSPLDGIGPDQLRIQALLRRLEESPVSEVILATNPTAEGDATALYVSRLLAPLVPQVTRIAQGVALGAELEYVDPGSLVKALENRRKMG
jgi:recombination protein RecR